MSRTRRNVLILSIAVVVLILAEGTREFVVYYQRSKELQGAYWRVKPGMTKADVYSAVGKPDATSVQSGEELLYWRAVDHQGPIIRQVMPAKGQYVLIVNFDEQGKVLDVYSSSN